MKGNQPGEFYMKVFINLVLDTCESFPKNMKSLISLKFNQKYS